MSKKLLKKLPEELINQIAAGEVIERPSSVVKELLDNAIDAGADQIRIKIVEGGIKLIEVTDNGTGIEQKDLPTVFDPHTTSKISSLEDLNNIMTMGFRGEALSTILSVAKVSVSSRFRSEEYAYSLGFKDSKPQKTSKTARNRGTTITVEDLFYNIPARRKFLKTPETEYRKILETLIPYFLQYSNIHFTLEKEGKEVYNLPRTSENVGVELNRIQSVLKGEFTKGLFSIRSEGEGMKVSGFISHPSFHQSKVSHQYILINKRPVWDNGIAKSVQLGYGRYIPQGERVPFVISIDIRPDLIDVNVHPRKEEVKFINPYRVYSQIENAVNKALNENMSLNNQTEKGAYTARSIQESPALSPRLFDASPLKYETGAKEINFSKRGKEFDVKESLQFSKEALKEIKDSGEMRNIFQLFNKYIVVEFTDELWMIDQHAAAERITYEKLERSYSKHPDEIQNLLVPTEILSSKAELSFIKENINFFSKLGFDLEVKEDRIMIKAMPAYFQSADLETIFRELWELSDDQRDVKNSLEKAKGQILATIACHGSIRKGQPLSREECIQVYKDLKECTNHYSCPHGRPIVWRMKLTEIDTHFDRTY